MVVPRSGVTTIIVDDLRKVLWDVTLGDSTPQILMEVGRRDSEECVVTGQLALREGDVYLWSLGQGEHCFVLSDPGTIPADGVLAYTLRLELPG